MFFPLLLTWNALHWADLTTTSAWNTGLPSQLV
jgi:hypothetical protein